MQKFIHIVFSALQLGLLLSCGSSKVDESQPVPLKTPDQLNYTYSILTGREKGFVDGKLIDAKFDKPYAITIDAQDNLYVADRGNFTIRVIKPDGTVSTLKNNLGKNIGTNYQVEAIKVDKQGTIYLVEFNTIAKITASGEKSTVCGTLFGTETGGYKDAKGDLARFNRPGGLVIGIDNSLYVTDLDNKLIRKVTPDGSVSTFAGTPKVQTMKDGDLKTATFNSPSGLSVDEKGNLYLSEYFNNVVRKISTDGQVTTIAGNTASGYSDGKGIKATFATPKGVYATKDGYIYVADKLNNSIRLIAPDGNVTTLYKGQQSFEGAHDVTVDSKGNVYFVVPGTNSIAKLTAQ